MSEKPPRLKRMKFSVIVFVVLGIVAFLTIPGMYGPSIPNERFSKEIWNNSDIFQRNRVIRDLVTNVLPGMTVDEVVAILGPSPTKEEMRRHDMNDVYNDVWEIRGGKKVIARRGIGHDYDEHEWDLIYIIGLMDVPIWDFEASADPEYLIIRFDNHGKFESWFIAGSKKWASIVDKDNKSTYKERR